jgi:hypothetical protein
LHIEVGVDVVVVVIDVVVVVVAVVEEVVVEEAAVVAAAATTATATVTPSMVVSHALITKRRENQLDVLPNNKKFLSSKTEKAMVTFSK